MKKIFILLVLFVACNTGNNGKDGINGFDGKNGLNGENGINGIDGKDGIDGKSFPDSGLIVMQLLDDTIQVRYNFKLNADTLTLTPYIIDITPTEIVLGWNKNPEPDLLKYNVYFNSVKVGSTTQNEYTYNHKDVLPGIYLITVTALDKSGNESGHSEAVEFEKE